MTKPTPDEIEAAKKQIRIGNFGACNYDCPPRVYDVVAAALEAYKPVDVDSLAVEITRELEIKAGRPIKCTDIWFVGNTIRFLAEKGIINGK